MGIFRRNRIEAEDADAAAEPTPSAPVDGGVDLARFRRLVEKSERLKAAGVDHDEIEARAARDSISFNEAVEAIDRELADA
ncbi:MAG TPA: hypothetical protein VF044_03850 [Actinomycetota bacterium]